MAANDKIMLFAKAKKLGIEGYRTMSASELSAAIKSADTATGSNGKTAAKDSSTNGASAKRGRKTATKTAVKSTPASEKPAKTAAGRKSAKSAPAAKSAKTGEAKRPATGGKTAAKSSTRKAAPRASAVNGDAGRNAIDNSSVDWTAPSAIGNSGGNRAIIMKLLRTHKGNVEKVFAKLDEKAQAMYGKTQDNRKRSKSSAQSLLRWHISRVKFDFVKDTGQHVSSQNRANYGASENPQAVQRRTARTSSAKSAGSSRKTGTARKSASKTAGTAKTAAKRSSKTKTAARSRGPQKGAQSRKRASRK